MTSQTISAKIGHWTDANAQTGTTAILFSDLARTVVDVRGGAPGTRETDLLQPGSQVRACNAIVLTGGSAFGLESATGVVSYLKEHGSGFPTPAGPVPIVPAAVIFDLSVGDATYPDADAGFAACEAAVPVQDATSGRFGAGTGATVRKFWGPELTVRAGIGIATMQSAVGNVTAIVVVNAGGAPTFLDDGQDSDALCSALLGNTIDNQELQATSIGGLVVDAAVDHRTLTRCAIAAHDGLARSIRPSHTLFDGDLFFASGLRSGSNDPAEIVQLAVCSELAVEQAIRNAVSLNR